MCFFLETLILSSVYFEFVTLAAADQNELQVSNLSVTVQFYLSQIQIAFCGVMILKSIPSARAVRYRILPVPFDVEN